MATGEDFAALARQQADRGAMYEWGAVGPDTFDCSGLAYWAAQQLGITIPRTTYDMVASQSSLIPIARGDLRSGDLVFSNWGDGADSHVGIYDGRGNLIEAPETGKPVTVTPFDAGYESHATNYRRIPGLGDGGGSGGTAGAFASGLQAGIGSVTGLAGWITKPSTLTDAMSNVGNAAGSLAQSAMSVGKLANLVTRALLPSNLVRGFAMLGGIILILVGIWLLAKEAGES